jgi:DNA-binding transcriptional LysR family regulator
MSKTPDVTTAQLAYFAEAADHLSMTRAAENLLVAQSAVSSSIAQLERAVGVQLFIRKPAKGLILTAAGERLHHEARSLLTRLDEALELARGQENEVRGVLTLACFVTLMPFYVPGLLSKLRSLHPNLRIDVIETDLDGMLEALRSGRAQLGLGYDFGLDNSVHIHEVTRAKPYVLLPEKHRLARKPSIALSQLRDEPMVLLDLPLSRDYFLDMLSAAGIEPEIRYRSGNYETVRSLVAQGHGFSILNQRPVSSVTYDGGSVVALPISNNAPALPVVIVSLNGVRPTARSRAVSDGIRSLVLGGSADTGAAG